MYVLPACLPHMLPPLPLPPVPSLFPLPFGPAWPRNMPLRVWPVIHQLYMAHIAPNTPIVIRGSAVRQAQPGPPWPRQARPSPAVMAQAGPSL